MEKRLYLALIVTLTATFVLIGCNANTVVVEEDSQEAESAELSVSEEIVVDEENAETELLSEEESELDEDMAEITESEEVAENTDEEVIPLEDSPIISMDTIMFAQRDINVRSGPGTDYEKIGALSTNDEVIVTGQDKESGWYQIEYGDVVAFVSDSYLGENKVVVAPSNSTNTNTENIENTTATNNTQNTDTAQTSQSNSEGSLGEFTADDMENALQFGEQFGMW